jgi:hypothetical protein
MTQLIHCFWLLIITLSCRSPTRLSGRSSQPKSGELQTTMAKIHKDVGKASTRLRQRAIATRNQKTHVRKANFRVGDYVLVAVPRKDRRHKLMATWRGPRRVVRLESHSILEVENLVKGTSSLVQCSHLKTLRGRRPASDSGARENE